MGTLYREATSIFVFTTLFNGSQFLKVPYAQELGTCIWGSCYNSTLCATGINVISAAGKNINPRFRFKIKASYIVSMEGDVRPKSYRTGH